MGQRIIGIRHRVKRTAEGEPRPTQVCIMQDGKMIAELNLETETDELDFIFGRIPLSFRKIRTNEDLSQFPIRHVKWRKLKKTEKSEDFPKSLLRFEEGFWYLAKEVPSVYEGLRVGDAVAMALGGSGDNLAYGLSKFGQTVGATVWRIPPFALQANRSGDKEKDAQNLSELLYVAPELFYPCESRDRALILVRECLRARNDAMKARIACEQRLRTRFIGQAVRDVGLCIQGTIEDQFAAAKASDKILLALAEEEKKREKDLIRALEDSDVYRLAFEPIEGIGPMIAARLIGAIGDIRLFATSPKLKAFCGAHLRPKLVKDEKTGKMIPLRDSNGKIVFEFPRRKHGAIANWQPDCRQALFLFGDQCNRRPDSYWGKYLRQMKANLRAVHLEVETINGKTRYSDAHIHKMALWRTISRFVERAVFKGWNRVIQNGTQLQEQEAA